MKRYLPTLLLAGLLIAGWGTLSQRFTVQPESRLWIDGTSSLHDWTCEAGVLDGQIDAAADAPADVVGVRLTVPVEQLECKNGTMNKKAHKALQEDDHPTIAYALTSAEPLAQDGGTQTLKATGELTIAGTVRTIQMDVQATPQADGRVRYSGQVPLTMTDFGVDPPKAMLGTLKTGDQVTVHFDVVAAR